MQTPGERVCTEPKNPENGNSGPQVNFIAALGCSRAGNVRGSFRRCSRGGGLLSEFDQYSGGTGLELKTRYRKYFNVDNPRVAITLGNRCLIRSANTDVDQSPMRLKEINGQACCLGFSLVGSLIT